MSGPYPGERIARHETKGYETQQFAVLVDVNDRIVEITCEDARDALRLAHDIGAVARPVVRRTTVTDWMPVGKDWM